MKLVSCSGKDSSSFFFFSWHRETRSNPFFFIPFHLSFHWFFRWLKLSAFRRLTQLHVLFNRHSSPEFLQKCLKGVGSLPSSEDWDATSVNLIKRQNKKRRCYKCYRKSYSVRYCRHKHQKQEKSILTTPVVSLTPFILILEMNLTFGGSSG